MKRPFALITLLFLATATLTAANAQTPGDASRDFGTIKLYFLRQPVRAQFGGGEAAGSGLGMGSGGAQPGATAAGVPGGGGRQGGGGFGGPPGLGGGPFGGGGLPAARQQTADVYIDGEFVGNALLPLGNVTPKFNLPPGSYEFRVECDGYRDYKQTLTVLGAESLQWLVVPLERAEKPDSTGEGTTKKDKKPQRNKTNGTDKTSGKDKTNGTDQTKKGEKSEKQ